MINSNFMLWRNIAGRPEMRPAWLVLALSIVGTLIFWQLAQSGERAAHDVRLNAMAAQVTQEINRRMTAYRQMLRAGAGMFATRLEVNRADWGRFVSQLKIDEYYPGTLGLGYATMVAPDELLEHEKNFRAVYGDGYQLHPQSTREMYSAIVFLEPDSWRNDKAIGFDMYSEPRRRAAMERAAAMGRVALSGKVKLVQEAETDVQPGVLLYFPVFKSNLPGTTLAERMQNVRGFVYTPLRVRDFMGEVLKIALPEHAEHLQLQIFDGETREKQDILFDNASAMTSPVPGELTVYSNYGFNGRSWTIRATSTPKFDAQVISRNPELILIVGLATNFLLWGLAASMALRRIEDADATAQMALLTRELSHRVKNTLAIVQSIANRSLTNDRSIQEGRDVFLKRLHALARAHTFLLNNSWRGAGLQDLVTAELSVFGARTTVEGPPVSLSPQLAQSMTLVAHELATNAVKYGALSNEQGRVSVVWSRAGGAPARLVFTWTETDGPTVTPPTRSGFGQILLRQTIGAGAAAEPIIEYRPAGLYYRVEISLDERELVL